MSFFGQVTGVAQGSVNISATYVTMRSAAHRSADGGHPVGSENLMRLPLALLLAATALAGCTTKYDLSGADWKKPGTLIQTVTLDEMECVRVAREARQTPELVGRRARRRRPACSSRSASAAAPIRAAC